MTRAEMMRKAAELLHDANCLQQLALGDYNTELCYDFHNDLEDLQDRFEEMAKEIEVAHLGL